MFRLLLTMFATTLLPACVTAADRPNLLLIVADDMGYGDLSCYGSKQIQTPNLDMLATNGVRCTDGYVSGSVCAPSRAGFMTGRYQGRFGFEHNLSSPAHVKKEMVGIPLDEPLISDRLKELGYRTGIVGKWHLGESIPEMHPSARGFDFFFGMLGGRHNYFPTPKKHQLVRNGARVDAIRTPYLTDWFTLEALDFIAADKNNKPWFLYLSYNTPHGPMQAKADDLAKFASITPKTRQIYCAMQHCMDVNIGKVIDLLKARGELENTLICFISDNGGSVEVSHAINAPLNGTKGTFFEGGIRVPTIWHWPAKIPAGKVYQSPVISLDVMPTFVAAAGGKPPVAGAQPEVRAGRKNSQHAIYDGVDLMPYFTETIKTPPHQTLYWRMTLRGSAIRHNNWKLMRTTHGIDRLFDLSSDVSEQVNLMSKHPQIAADLIARLAGWQESMEANPMWISAPFWLKYNRKLYEKNYQLTQPK